MSKIYLPITADEFLRLSQLARQECRTPHDQARYLLRLGLGLAGASPPADQQRHNRAVCPAKNSDGAVVEANL